MPKVFNKLMKQKGLALLLATVSIPVFMLFLVLVVDITNQYLVRTEMQGAAIAGALAGAQNLRAGGTAGSPTNVSNTAIQFAQANKVNRGNLATSAISVSQGTWNYTTKVFTVSSTRSAVKVTINYNNSYFFLAFAPKAQEALSVTAIAAIRNASNVVISPRLVKVCNGANCS